MRIFWSWQNDFSPDTCRHFIREALAEAVDLVGQDLGMEDAERPELDHDTMNTPGMVEIPATILRKISSSAVFVADLTPIGHSANGKALPNPNVLIELGWAMQKPGSERVIVVINTASGWQPDDLPFDIRHRRALTYELADSADQVIRNAVHTTLVDSLAGLLRANLGQHLEDAAASKEIVGVAANPDDPSIWASAGDVLTHNDTLGRSHKTSVSLPSCERGYIRVIPAAWTRGIPSVSDIERLPNGQAVWPQAEGSMSGDFGAFDDGFVRYWLTGSNSDGKSETRNVAAFLEETGEFWVLHGTAIVEKSKHRMLAVDSLLGGWSKVMRSAFTALDRFGAHRARKVELGLVGVRDVRWPGQWEYESPPARKDRFVFHRQSRDWSEKAQISFLTDAYNGVRNIFSLPKVNLGVVEMVLKRWDPDRFKVDE